MGCFANAALKDDTQKKWGALETQGRVVFKAGNGQDIVMPISFKGLKDALNALANDEGFSCFTPDGGITWTATFTPAASIADSTNLITIANTGVQDIDNLAWKLAAVVAVTVSFATFLRLKASP